MKSPGGPDGGEADDHFSRLVEQEVDKRLFQEKIMRAESGEYKRLVQSWTLLNFVRKLEF